MDQTFSKGNNMDQVVESLVKKSPKKVHIETWGCQMNVADSEKILSLMKKEQFEMTQQADDADLIVLNTCHIREKAKHKVLSRLGVLRELKERNQDLKIAVAGCVAQAEGNNFSLAKPRSSSFSTTQQEEPHHPTDASSSYYYSYDTGGSEDRSSATSSSSQDDCGLHLVDDDEDQESVLESLRSVA